MSSIKLLSFLYWLCLPAVSVFFAAEILLSPWKWQIICFHFFDISLIIFSASKVVCSIFVNKVL